LHNALKYVSLLLARVYKKATQLKAYAAREGTGKDNNHLYERGKMQKIEEKQYAMINGFRMRYRIRGKGHPVFFVTGLLGSIEQEDALAGDVVRLKERYAVIHHDSRGRGKSDWGSLDASHYTWEGEAEDLVALLDHLGIERGHFIGGSQGAAAVLALASRYPDRVSALILRNPPEVRQHDQRYIKGIMDYADFIEKNGMDAVTDLILSLPPNNSLKITHPSLYQSYDRVMREQDPRVVAAATRGTVLFAPITPEDLKHIQCPTLILSQKGDDLHPTDIAEYLSSNIRDCETFIAPTLTYYNENPQEGPQRVLAFLSRIDGTVW